MILLDSRSDHGPPIGVERLGRRSRGLAGLHHGYPPEGTRKEQNLHGDVI